MVAFLAASLSLFFGAGFAVMLIFGPLPVGVVMSLPARAVAERRRALASGVFTSFLFLGAAAIPALAAWFGETVGGEGVAALEAGIAFCGFGALTMLIPFILFERATAAE